jgi:hypothetical protein
MMRIGSFYQPPPEAAAPLLSGVYTQGVPYSRGGYQGYSWDPNQQQEQGHYGGNRQRNSNSGSNNNNNNNNNNNRYPRQPRKDSSSYKKGIKSSTTIYLLLTIDLVHVTNATLKYACVRRCFWCSDLSWNKSC